MFMGLWADFNPQSCLKSQILRSYCVPENSPVIKRFQRVCSSLGFAGELRSTLGGSDNSNFLKAGISGIVLSCGMQRVHSTDEYITLQELVRGSKLVAGLICDDERTSFPE